MNSTHKSGSYINGMLDSIARHLIETGKLMKTMDTPKPKKVAEEPKKAVEENKEAEEKDDKEEINQ